MYTNSWCSSTASVNKAPLQLAKRKAEMMHASPGASFLDVSIEPFFQRPLLCLKTWQRRKGETSQLASKTASLFIQLHCAKPKPLCSHDAMLCTAQALTAQISACLGHDSVLSSPAWGRLASRSRAAGTWGSLVLKTEISTNFLYQRTWCCENCSYGPVTLFTFF